MKKDQTKTGKKKWVVLIVLGAVAVVLGVGAVIGFRYVNRILKQPETVFQADTSTPIPQNTAIAPAFPIPTDAAENDRTVGTETEKPELPSSGITEEQQTGIVNIMLMGIDAYEDGGTTSGTVPHTDSMMVIAVNFDQSTVDLITLPRDTFTTIPGHSGFYKLNSVFNVGLNGKFNTSGKADDLADGFKLTCRTAEEWLGGISIPYYYGVDFQAVMDIVDAIGGIDYDVDQAFRSMSGRKSYGVGMHHLDGDAVMGYLRIRQSADGLDSSRTARQRRMMVAIFKKLKSEGKLTQIPSLISAANSGIYTNTTLGQTAALVNFAANLDTDQLRTRAMSGDIGTIETYWRFAYVDQQNRIDLIKEVYGIDAAPVITCTRQYERWLNRIGFATIKHIHQIEKVLTAVQEKKDAGETFTDEQIDLYVACYTDYTALRDAYLAYSEELGLIYIDSPWREHKENSGSWTDDEKKQDREIYAREAGSESDLRALSENARTSLMKLANAIGYRKVDWSLSDRWYSDPDVNEVYVNFG